MMSFILASGSPRRKELLASLNVPFDLILPTVDERDCDVTGLAPAEQVAKLAQFKGESVAQAYPDRVVIAADTLVAIDGLVLGKPVDAEDAAQMLQRLQGQTHTVYSAIAVFYQGQSCCEALATQVKMRSLTPPEIQAYIATGEPMDKAGAYAIQGVGSLLITEISGCYFNVVGMSLQHLATLLKRLNPKCDLLTGLMP